MIVADGHIQAFVFIASDGTHVSKSRKQCMSDKDCIALATAVITAGDYESINVGDCSTAKEASPL